MLMNVWAITIAMDWMIYAKWLDVVVMIIPVLWNFNLRVKPRAEYRYAIALAIKIITVWMMHVMDVQRLILRYQIPLTRRAD